MARMIDVIGVPFAFGAQEKGLRDAPKYLVEAGLLRVLSAHGHNVEYTDLCSLSGRPDVFAGFGVDRHKVPHFEELTLLTSMIGRQSGKSLIEGSTPIVLGGDHSITIGAAGAALDIDVNHGRTVGLVWVDARYDVWTEEMSHPHETQRMTLSTLIGCGTTRFRRLIGNQAYLPSRVIHVGAREEGGNNDELRVLERYAIERYPDSVIQCRGWYQVFAALNRLSDRVDAIWVSIDLEALARQDAPGVHGSFHQGGLSRHEMLSLMRALALTRKVIGVDVVGYDPHQDRVSESSRPLTAQLVIEVIDQLLK